MNDDVQSKLGQELFPEEAVETIADTAKGQEVEAVEEKPQEATVIRVKVGEKEYTQDELSHLVKLGEIGREAEEKYNTKIDKVWPEFTQKSQKLKELEEKQNAINEQPKIQLPENEEQAIREAKEAAKKLGIVTVEQFEELLGKSYKKFYEQERTAERILDDARKMEKDIDGSDGRPAFKGETVLQFMVENGVQDMNTAYKIMNEKALDEWKEQQLGKAKKPSITTQEKSQAGSVKIPVEPRVTSANFDALLEEALHGSSAVK